MTSWRIGILTIAVAATGWCCAAAAAQQEPAIPCGGDAIAHGHASRIIDGRTFVLDDGREVRLAAVEVPPLAKDTPARPGTTTAKAALDALVGGDEVVLRRAEFPSDRYGRLFAYVYAIRDGDELFAQGELIASGFARIGDHVGNPACAAELLQREAAARKAKLGLWADSYYEVLHADNPADVLAQRGRFALVEGTVVSVHESGPTIYVNFGQHWSEDFSVTVPKRSERSFAAAGLDPKSLTGRRIMVRGWIEARITTGGPWIAALYPEQIEPADHE
jgi:endonuclease YncB( thermonuclease family)